MKLSKHQISKVYKKVQIKDLQIVLIDVSEDNIKPSESNFNIYCVDDEYNIIWQIKETKSKPIDDADMFVYLGTDNENRIIADRFSGFRYVIDADTGEAVRVSFHK